jgi:hypothetical protein
MERRVEGIGDRGSTERATASAAGGKPAEVRLTYAPMKVNRPVTSGKRTGWGRRARAASAVLALLGLARCSEDLAPQSLVDGFRIIAVRADIPDAVPGDTVTLDALLGDPTGDGRAVSYLWVACHLGPARDPAACADFESGAIVGVGFLPTFSFTAPAPSDGETEAQVMVTLLVCAGGTFTFPGDGGTPTTEPQCSGGDGATAYKRVFARAADERNHNPALAGLTRDGAAWTEPELRLPACAEGSCEPVEVVATWGEGSAETWTEIAFGSPRSRTEDIFVSWFATAGSFGRTRSAGEEPTVEWTPPAGPATIDFWIVGHDGRGGTDWTARRIIFE